MSASKFFVHFVCLVCTFPYVFSFDLHSYLYLSRKQNILSRVSYLSSYNSQQIEGRIENALHFWRNTVNWKNNRCPHKHITMPNPTTIVHIIHLFTLTDSVFFIFHDEYRSFFELMNIYNLKTFLKQTNKSTSQTKISTIDFNIFLPYILPTDLFLYISHSRINQINEFYNLSKITYLF